MEQQPQNSRSKVTAGRIPCLKINEYTKRNLESTYMFCECVSAISVCLKTSKTDLRLLFYTIPNHIQVLLFNKIKTLK